MHVDVQAELEVPAMQKAEKPTTRTELLVCLDC